MRPNTAFRRLFASQFISGLGTMVSYVTVPWQLYQLTHSNAQVGLLGLVHVVRALGRATARRMGAESDPALAPQTSTRSEMFKV